MNLSELIIRQALEADAESFLSLWDALDTETEFMLFAPNERQATYESQKERLANATDSQLVRIFVLEDTDKKQIAGFCAGRRSGNSRDRHTLEIVIGLQQAYTGKGWGFQLLQHLEQWAKLMQVSRLQLNVMVNNTRAISLYKRLGFDVEGTMKNSVCLDSGFVDEHIMAKQI